jgi:methanogenic corrinoid protein MtbC1
MSVESLRELERAAQARNRAEGITGLAVYEDGRFFQWIEGPADSLARVWESVRRDGRHTEIADVAIRSTPARVFDGWDMALAIRGDGAFPARTPPTGLLSLVPALDPLEIVLQDEPPVQWGKDPGAGPVIPLAPILVEAVLVPQMFSKHSSVRRFLPPASPAATRLTRLLLADDVEPAVKALRKLYAGAGSLASLCATVIEPVARNIGDLWIADDCSQLAMTMALVRLQTIVRQLNVDAVQVAIGLPAVLVAPLPGEVHALGACLDAELLWQAGWDTHREFPETDAALQTLLAGTWFDVLDLSLSTALACTERLPSMAETIAGARAASLNPSLTVLVGGRAFFEQCEASAQVGADASATSALHVVLTATSARELTLTKQAQLSALVSNS